MTIYIEQYIVHELKDYAYNLQSYMTTHITCNFVDVKPYGYG